jgi:hypothetical protein
MFGKKIEYFKQVSQNAQPVNAGTEHSYGSSLHTLPLKNRSVRYVV